jgi:hypothetical protein
MAAAKVRRSLTLRDRLSHLSFLQACKLLGKNGRELILHGATYNVLPEDVYLGDDLLRVTLRRGERIEAIPTLTLSGNARDRLLWNCDRCRVPCDHVGALFSLVLEHKTDLGLAKAPPKPEAHAHRNEEQLEAAAIDERRKRARSERMTIRSTDPSTPWTDYQTTSALSGKTYRVAMRGMHPGKWYCTCPDFRSNTLGVCKHVFKVEAYLRRRFTPRQLAVKYRPTRVEVYLRYEHETTLRVLAPEKLPAEQSDILAPVLGKPIEDVGELLRRLQRLERAGGAFHMYPDAEQFIDATLHAERVRDLVAEMRRNPAGHPLRTSLLKVPLLPYQVEGIAFVVGAGRAVLADEMGLGKTIQAIGAVELLAREADVKRVLVICPASLKSQWRSEIERFCERNVQLVSGSASERAARYAGDSFFTVCNYEQVLKDLAAVEQTPWDVIVLDEGQRIKNWEAKTARVIKGLRSRFALVLSGTPLENRLDELYSIIQFIDERRLGPGFRFFHRHRLTDERGKVLGYKNLNQLRSLIAPVLLRRTRDSVRLQLPERNMSIVRIPPTAEQKALHDAHMQIVAKIVRKRFLTEMDLMRLRAALLMCRMAANASTLVDKLTPNWSTKLDRLAELFDELADEPENKVVLFSEWTGMLDLIEPLLKKRRLPFVRLDGSVPQHQRQALVHRFQTEPDCRVFLTTNAGSTGLNLQAANTVINVDLPWNPAVLEQRIARAHRLGQTRGVQVFVLVTEQTLEESLLGTLAAKKDLALAALDPETEVDTVELRGNTDELKAKLEILLGAKPEAPLDESLRTETAATVDDERRRRVAEAGGQLLGAAFQFLGELVNDGAPSTPKPSEALVGDLRSRLDACVESDADGRPRLTIALPDRSALDQLATTLARLLVAGGAQTAG